MVRLASKSPTHVKQLVARRPQFIGECDACRYGLGGIWISGPYITNLIVWRLELLDNIIERITRTGDITISDLEMTAHLLHFVILEYIAPLEFLSVGIFSDNTPTVTWAIRLSSKSMLAGKLLRALTVRQYITKSSHVVTTNIKGSKNIRTGNASRWFNNHRNKDDPKLSHEQCLLFFNSSHPIQTKY